MKLEAIIFDLYNTLIYTTVRKNSYSRFFNQVGLSKDEISYWVNRVMTKNYGYLQEIANEVNAGSFIYTTQFEKDIQEEVQSTRLFDDTISTLEYLSLKYKIYLLSNVSTPYKECVFNLGIDKYFDKLFFSCDIGHRKPQSEAFNMVIEHSGLHPNQILMIGDSKRSDYEGALNCGIRSILKINTLSEIISENSL
jgi:putative hydrolase of the HAD superfamily